MNKHSLRDILNEEIEFEGVLYTFQGIQIPIIQRDYAQGRKSETVIRKRFLKTIFNSLHNNEELELDFVYGAKKSIDSKDLFVPLDGQQRITTLYLLYWYIGNRELEGLKLDNLREILSKFNYATRTSSNKFCEKLVEESISFKKNPSIEIMDSSWFFDSFKLDPTVQSMLIMLDEIHMEYGDENLELFSKIDNIKFYFLPLDGFDLTDELYIKMNARGKQLTHFENFKADLLKWIQNEQNPYRADLYKETKYKGSVVNYNLYFELKLDIDWTNLFWKYSKNQNEKLIDPIMMQFFNRYFLNSYVISSNLGQTEFENDNYFKFVYGNQGDDSKIVYNDFSFYAKTLETTLIEQNSIFKIEKVLDALTKHSDEINQLIKPNWNKDDNWNLFSKSINQRQRIIFLATTAYLEKNDFDKENFSDWMRIVWNIIIDPNIRSVPAMIGALRYISNLSSHSNKILDYISNVNLPLFDSNATFHNQILEEHKKAILIQKSKEWKNEIIEAESHKLFQGNIMFLLDDKVIQDIEYFNKIKKVAFEIFEKNDLTDKSINYLWIRALLAKCTSIELPVTLSNGRFNNWRYLINGPFIKAMQFLLSEIINSPKQAEECMKEICNNYQVDPNHEWLFPIVNWVGNDGKTLIGDYTETRKLQKYNNYGNDPEHVYLYNITIWTDGNINLTSNRNQFVSKLLKSTPYLKTNNPWFNIDNDFFRGWNILLNRTINDINFTYIIDRSNLSIGVKYSPELEAKIPNLYITETNKKNGWVFTKKFPFDNLLEDQMISLISEIESDIFDENNAESEINKLQTTTNV